MLPTYDEYGIWPRSGHLLIAQSSGNKNLTCQNSPDQKGIQQVDQKIFLGPSSDVLQEIKWPTSVCIIISYILHQ